MNLNKEPGWACDACRYPLEVMAEPSIDRETGEEDVGLIEVCQACLEEEHNEAYGSGYKDGYAEPCDRCSDAANLAGVARRVLDALELYRRPDRWDLDELERLLLIF